MSCLKGNELHKKMLFFSCPEGEKSIVLANVVKNGFLYASWLNRHLNVASMDKTILPFKAKNLDNKKLLCDVKIDFMKRSFSGITQSVCVLLEPLFFPHSKILRNIVKSDIKTLYEQNTELFKCNIFGPFSFDLLKGNGRHKKVTGNAFLIPLSHKFFLNIIPFTHYFVAFCK